MAFPECLCPLQFIWSLSGGLSLVTNTGVEFIYDVSLFHNPHPKLGLLYSFLDLFKHYPPSVFFHLLLLKSDQPKLIKLRDKQEFSHWYAEVPDALTY